MKDLSRCFLCKNKTYIMINYSTNKKIEYEVEKKLTRIFDNNYNHFRLPYIVEIIRTVLKDYQENTLRVAVAYPNDTVDLVYFSKGKIVKYIKKVPTPNNQEIKIEYSTKKGLVITSKDKGNNLNNILPGELGELNHLEDIKGIELTTEDKLLNEFYTIFYSSEPNFLSNNVKIKAQIMMYILNEYGIRIGDESFILYNNIPFSSKISESIRRLSIVAEVPRISIRKDIKKQIYAIGDVLNDDSSNLELLIAVSSYLYKTKYQNKNINDKNSYKLIKEINKKMEEIK